MIRRMSFTTLQKFAPTWRPTVASASTDGEKWTVTVLLALLLANGNALPELTTMIAAVAAFAIGGAAAVQRGFLISVPIIAALVLGAIVTFAWGQFNLDAVRAAYIYLRVPAHLALGIAIILRYRDLRIVLNAVMLAAAVLSVYFIVRYILTPDIATQSRFVLRTTLAGGWILLPLAIGASVYILRTWRSRPMMWTIALFAVIGLCSITTLLSLSRTAATGAVVVLAFLLGLFPLRGYARIQTPLFIALLFVFTTPVLQSILPVDRLAMFDQGAPPVVRELMALDRLDRRGVNEYWRGYETFTAFNFVWSKGPAPTVFGTGLDSLVPLRDLQHLQGDQAFESIPLFHNMFSFALVRAGLLGVFAMGLLYVFLAIPLQRLAFSTAPGTRLFGRLACGVHFSALLSIPSTTGLINGTELASTILIVLGAAIAMDVVEREASPHQA
jgi:hypothetical protein